MIMKDLFSLKIYPLVLTGVFLIAFIVIATMINAEAVQVTKGLVFFERNITFTLFAILTVIVTPIFEELAFRGHFSRNGKKYIISILFLLISVCIKQSILLGILCIIHIILFYHSRRSKNDKLYMVSMTSSVLLFGLFHLSQLTDISFIDVKNLMFFSFLGSVFLFVCYNFSLKKAIILHSSYNLILILIMLYQIQFNKFVIESSTNKISISIIQKPYYSAEKSVSIAYDSNDGISCKDCTINMMLSELGSKKAANITPYSTFDISIKNKLGLSETDFKNSVEDELNKLMLISDLN